MVGGDKKIGGQKMLNFALVLGYYIINSAVLINFIDKFPLLLFIIVLYILPLVVNCWAVAKNKYLAKVTSISFPAIAVLAYYITAIFLNSSSKWKIFVENNTVTQGDYSIKIQSDLASFSQVLFVVILYYSVALMFYLIMKRKGR